MRRTLLAVTALLFAGFAAREYTSTECIIWDGKFDLAVHVSCESDPPRVVRCHAYGHQDDAEAVAATPSFGELWNVTADPFDGKSLTVRVPLSGRDSMSGRELRRTQFRYLVVVGDWPDGRHVGKVVDIPDCRVSRVVSVTFP